MTLVLASARVTISDYISAVIQVYVIVIFAWIVLQWLINFGVRLPYSRATDAIIGFLRDVVEPFLRLFRPLSPKLGGLDLSPLIAIVALELVNDFIVQGILRG
jgi:YggT family protein